MGSKDKVFSMNQVFDTFDSFILHIKREKPGGVLGGSRHHQQVVLDVNVRLSLDTSLKSRLNDIASYLTPILVFSHNIPCSCIPNDNTNLSYCNKQSWATLKLKENCKENVLSNCLPEFSRENFLSLPKFLQAQMCLREKPK